MVPKKDAAQMYLACNRSANKEACWQGEINRILREENVGKAFDFIEYMYREDSHFAASCHGLTHDLGKQAYRTFKSNKDSAFSQKAYYCGYGFYHGFMEELLHTSKDMAEARLFCRQAQEKLAKYTKDAEGACFHGIGHGIVEDVPARENWGDAQRVIKPGIDLCEKVSDSATKLYRCVSGVFNAIEILMSHNKYELKNDPLDPFWLCRIQPDRYKEACYTQFVVPVKSMAGRDYAKGVGIIDTIEEDQYAIPALESYIFERSRSDPDDYPGTIELCRGIAERFHLPCIGAYAEGFLKYGPPQNEYLKAMDFCGFDALTNDEKHKCFQEFLGALRVLYTVEKAERICQSIEENYRYNDCEYADNQ
jgi:hypothetical protein